MNVVRRASHVATGSLLLAMLALTQTGSAAADTAAAPAGSRPYTGVVVGPTGSSPWAIATGDLDGDGDQDLVTADSSSRTVTILSRQPDGTYSATTAGPTGSGPRSIVVADLDRDGDLDIATANSGANTVTILVRDATGAYTASTAGATGRNPNGLVAADLDGDGDVDLATADTSANGNGGNSITVLSRNPGGTYTPSTIASVLGSPQSLVAADLDHDGDLDLATASTATDSVTVATRGADGSYTVSTAGPTGDAPFQVAVGDLDHDGDLDLAAVNLRSNSVTVLRRDASGTYAPTTAGPTGSSPWSIAIGDLDDDGLLDIATANSSSNTVTELHAEGGGGYTPVTAGGTGASPLAVAIADLDHDGDLDLATADNGANAVTILTNTAVREPVTYLPSTVGTAAPEPRGPVVADLDRDGDLDLVTSSGSTNTVSVLSRGPGGTYTGAAPGPTGSRQLSTAVADVDGDGDLDIVSPDLTTNTVTLLIQGPDGSYTPTTAGPSARVPYAVAVADLDGDGDLDIATASSSDDLVMVLTRGSDGTYTVTTAGPTGSFPAAMVADDLDEDGDLDLATVNFASNNVTLLTRGSDGAYTSTTAGPTGSGPFGITAADLDDDGDLDLATADFSANRVTVLTRGPGGAYSRVDVPVGTNPFGVAAGDLDGDGDLDLATSNSGSNTVSVLTRGANGTYTAGIAGPTGSSPSGLAIDDLDDDGDLDLVTGNNRSSSVTILTATPPDTTAPTVALSAPAGPFTQPFTVTATFSEPVTGLTASDFTVVNGVASNLAGSGTTYTVTITPAADGQVAVDLAAAAAMDAAGNPSTAAAQLVRTADSTRPTVELLTGNDPVNVRFQVTARFSEPVTDFTIGDVRVTNGTAANLVSNAAGDAYTFTVDPAGDGRVTVDVPAAAAADAAGNQNVAAPQLAVTADVTRPSVVLTAPDGPVTGPFTVTATFSEPVTGFALGDLSVGNGTASNPSANGAGDVYTFTVTPTADGSVTVDVPPGAADDAVGNPSEPATRLVRTADATQPSVTLTAPDAPTGTVTGPFTVTATFSEAVGGLTPDDFTVGNGTARGLAGSSTTYTITVTPTGDGQVTVDLAAGAALDDAGNPSKPSNQLVRTADVTRPTVTLDAANGANGAVTGPFTATATFSEAVTGLTVGDLVIGNGTASNLQGSGTSYTFTVTPTADGQVTIDLAEGAATDAAGNPSTAATRVTRTADVTRPSVTLAAPAGTVTGPFSVTATFSEAVTGLTTNDLVVGNGAASGLTGTGTTYTVTVTPAGDGPVTVDLTDGAATDAAGNLSTAAARLVRTAVLTKPAPPVPPAPTPPAPGACTITGTPGDDVLRGTADDDVICGLGGDDTFMGSAGQDTLIGGPGDDTMRDGTGNGTVRGGPGNDTLYGGEGDDVLRGGGGRDRVLAGAGDDLLKGGAGNDHLDGNTGRDRLDGGAGTDQLNGGPGRDTEVPEPATRTRALALPPRSAVVLA